MGKVLKGRHPLRVSKGRTSRSFSQLNLFLGASDGLGMRIRTVGSERVEGRDANSPQPTIQKCV